MEQGGGFTSAGARQTEHWSKNPNARVVKPAPEVPRGQTASPEQRFADLGGLDFLRAALAAKATFGAGPSVRDVSDRAELLRHRNGNEREGVPPRQLNSAQEQMLAEIDARIRRAEADAEKGNRISSALATGDRAELRRLIGDHPKMAPWRNRL